MMGSAGLYLFDSARFKFDPWGIPVPVIGPFAVAVPVSDPGPRCMNFSLPAGSESTAVPWGIPASVIGPFASAGFTSDPDMVG